MQRSSERFRWRSESLGHDGAGTGWRYANQSISCTCWAQRKAVFHGVGTWSPTIDPEALKILSLQMVAGAKVHLLLHAWARAPVSPRRSTRRYASRPPPGDAVMQTFRRSDTLNEATPSGAPRLGAEK